ncbi:MAG TPA: YtxH domain-containing protein [Ruminiclostridium sp.]
MMMRNFARGLVIGGLIGASISVLANSEIVNPHMRKKMMKSGRKIMSGSNNVLSDIAHLFM